MSKKTRIRIEVPQLKSRDDAEAAMGELALTTLNQVKLTAKMDAEIVAVRARYADQLAECERAVQEKTKALEVWALAHPEEFPKGRKSVELTQGVIGFRTGTPTLALASRAWSWEKVLSNLRSFWPGFVRTKEEIDKERIIAERATFPLEINGLRVVQRETFYADPKVTEVETRQEQPAAA